MKFIRHIIRFLLFFIAISIALAYIFDVDYLLKGIRTIYLKGHTTAFLEDYQAFDNDTVRVSKEIPWPIHSQYNSVAPTQKLLQAHSEYQTVAYLIIQNDSIWYEQYYDGFDANSKTNSFSMAKSMVSGLLGKAIMDGYIESLDQPLSDFFPQYATGLGAKTTVGDLSSMSSGLDWDESYYSPFSITTRAYFDDDLAKVMLQLDIVEEPGVAFKYLSGSTQLLAMVIEKASGKKLADYFSESFWQPLGAKNEALWQLDSKEHGLVKAYCCFASNARDFARFGKLYKDFGKFNGQQLLDSTFVVKSITPRFDGAPYGYGFWLDHYQGKNLFAMRGHLGQLVIVIPEDNVIIVRLGHRIDKSQENRFSPHFWTFIEEAYSMMER